MRNVINPTDWRGYVNDNVVVHMHKWLRRITMFEVAHARCYIRESSPKNAYLNHPPAASTMNGNSVVILQPNLP